MLASSESARLFGDSVLYIPYADPGYTLFKLVESCLTSYRAEHGVDPSVLLLQNHGIFVGSDTPTGIEITFADVLTKISNALSPVLPSEYTSVTSEIVKILPGLRMLLSANGKVPFLKIHNSELIAYYSSSAELFSLVSVPFTPDVIVYCKSRYLYLSGDNANDILSEASEKIAAFVDETDYYPRVIMIRGIGLVGMGGSVKECDTILSIYEDMLRVASYASSFGGVHPLEPAQISFIDNWEVENYRRSVGKVSAESGRVLGKVIVITGAAQGFGAGIARYLLEEGASVIISDINAAVGESTATSLSAIASGSSSVLFVQADVSNATSVESLVYRVVCEFGGIDVLISNAGVLRAGSLEELPLDSFDFVTKVNYYGYYYCVRAVSSVMKLQSKYGSADNYHDIIQLNSKSGLRGSRANFAYAGSKFGGIGLTQSFALELAPYRIKVNAVCPGNYYDGPLWSDPEKGLFVQYLRAGKVPGAKTVEEVRSYYMSQAPLSKGVTPLDVVKGILYLIEQTCETGQALPITGGQVMLN
jgi:NAD(P)-dependent dehydrogenase (short-subunit alcohol dehydrogenase family)